MQHLLVPLDFSDDSLYALEHALQLARPFSACVHLLHVVESSAVAGPMLGDAAAGRAPERLLSEAEEHLDGVRARLLAGHPSRAEVRLGSAPEQIIAYGREHAVDLIVMGTHGQRGPSRLLLGGTVERVVRQAACPVMSVRHPDRWVEAPAPRGAHLGASSDLVPH